MQIEGRCHCGKVAREADPDAVGICHCADCQTLSGSPYRVAIPAAATDFVLVRGDPKIYIKTAESGAKRAGLLPRLRHPDLCGGCAPLAALFVAQWDAIRQRAALRPGRQVRWRSALPWSVDISALETREGE